jgi:hypothetical protein
MRNTYFKIIKMNEKCFNVNTKGVKQRKQGKSMFLWVPYTNWLFIVNHFDYMNSLLGEEGNVTWILLVCCIGECYHC